MTTKIFNTMELESILNDPNVTIIDVRTPEEFSMGHVTGSENIPMNIVPQKLDYFRQMKKPIVLCCASGNRSGSVAGYLQGQGIEKVYNGGGWADVAASIN